MKPGPRNDRSRLKLPVNTTGQAENVRPGRLVRQPDRHGLKIRHAIEPLSFYMGVNMVYRIITPAALQLALASRTALAQNPAAQGLWINAGA